MTIWPKLVEEIKGTDAFEVYEFDEATVSKIDQILALYVINSGLKENDRGREWHKGLEQADRLAKSTQQFLDDLKVATYNPFLINALLDLFRPHPGNKENPFLNRSWDTELLLQMPKLIEALQAVDETMFERPGLPAVTIPKKDWYKRTVVHDLDRLLEKAGINSKDEERTECISELLRIIGVELENKTIANLLSSDISEQPDYFQPWQPPET